MTQQQFDELALKVAKKTWFALVMQPTSPTECEVYPAPHSEQSIIEFANRLRDEWVKGLEPVAWRFSKGPITKLDSWPHGGNWEPLYTHPTPAMPGGKYLDDKTYALQIKEAWETGFRRGLREGKPAPKYKEVDYED